MKQYSIILFALLVFSSCEEWENSAVPSEPTYFPLMEIQGDAEVSLECDAISYTDEGCIAIEGGEEIDVETVPIGLYFGGAWEGDFVDGHWVYDELPADGPDLYEYQYLATNVDGIPAATGRSVFWPECNGDLVTSIAGVYKMTVARNGSTPAGYSNNGPFFIIDLGSNVYALSDGMGGWYEHGRGFGPYDGPSLGMRVTANDIPSNNFTYGPTFSQNLFGGPVNTTAFSVNAVAKTISFTTTWDSDNNGTTNYTFVVTLTQCPDGVACWD